MCVSVAKFFEKESMSTTLIKGTVLKGKIRIRRKKIKLNGMTLKLHTRWLLEQALQQNKKPGFMKRITSFHSCSSLIRIITLL